jgi:hypothetical protein
MRADYLDAARRNTWARKALGPDARCRNCIFWELDGWWQEKQLQEDADNIWSDVTGECRRRAPSPLQVLIEDIRLLIGMTAWAVEEQANVAHDKSVDYEGGSMRDFSVNQWPSTGADDWCGEFQAGRKAMSADDIAHLEALHNVEYPPKETEAPP